MAHVVIEGPVDPGRIFHAWEPVHETGDGWVLRTGPVFLSQAGDLVLVEAVVVEHGRRQRFFVRISPKAGGVNVRLEPIGQPEATRGVLQLLARIAARIRQRFPGTRYAKSALGDVLET